MYDRIIQFACALVDSSNGTVVHTFDRYVDRDGRRISPGAAATNKIDQNAHDAGSWPKQAAFMDGALALRFMCMCLGSP